MQEYSRRVIREVHIGRSRTETPLYLHPFTTHEISAPTAFNQSCRVLVAASLRCATALAGQSAPTPLRDHLDPCRLQVRRDSFIVVIRGAPRGWQVLSTARDGAGWLLGDTLSIAGMVSQSSVIRFDSGLDETSLRQEGTMMGKPMRITLDVSGLRVTGVALTPINPSGELAIDAARTPGLIDDNAVTPLLAFVRWRDGFAASFPVLLSGKGTVTDFSVRTLGLEQVTIPAGQFDTWRVELQMGQARMVANVTTAAPYRIVRMSNGPAFEMQLIR